MHRLVPAISLAALLALSAPDASAGGSRYYGGYGGAPGGLHFGFGYRLRGYYPQPNYYAPRYGGWYRYGYGAGPQYYAPRYRNYNPYYNYYNYNPPYYPGPSYYAPQFNYAPGPYYAAPQGYYYQPNYYAPAGGYYYCR